VGSTRTVPGMAELWIGEDGILTISICPEDGVVDGPGITRVIDQHVALADGRKTPVLVDARRARRMSREARELASGPRVAAVTSVLAVLIGSPVSAMIGNFFLYVSRPHYPTRLFYDEAAARMWLLQPDATRDAGGGS